MELENLLGSASDHIRSLDDAHTDKPLLLSGQRQRIQERIDAGVEEIFLHTMTADERQLELFAEHILKPFAKVKSAR